MSGSELKNRDCLVIDRIFSGRYGTLDGRADFPSKKSDGLKRPQFETLSVAMMKI